MNLGQAVAVCLYELAARAFLPDESGRSALGRDAETPVEYPSGAKAGDDIEACDVRAKALACQPVPFNEESDSFCGVSAGIDSDMRDSAAACGELELLAGVVEETMIAAGYSPSSMREANRHDLRLLLRRLGPSRRDSRRILGLFRRILWRLKRVP